MNYFHTLEYKGIRWVQMPEQSEKALRALGAEFKYLDADIQESLPPLQRAKIAERKGYFFIVLHFPIFDVIHRRLRFTEIDVFLEPKLLTVVHDNQLTVLKDSFNRAVHDDDYAADIMGGGAVPLFLELWKRLLDNSFNQLLRVNDEINRLDRKLFTKAPNHEVMEELLRLRTNIVTLRRTIGPHKIVLDRLSSYGEKFLDLKKYKEQIHELKEFISEQWHLLDSQMESSVALHEAVESVVAVHTSEAMKIFTVISVITFPLTLLATLFAVRAGGTPLIDSPVGFWVLFWLCLLGAAAMVKAFKKKGLL